jgi:hypothetical protein
LIHKNARYKIYRIFADDSIRAIGPDSPSKPEKARLCCGYQKTGVCSLTIVGPEQTPAVVKNHNMNSTLGRQRRKPEKHALSINHAGDWLIRSMKKPGINDMKNRCRHQSCHHTQNKI